MSTHARLHAARSDAARLAALLRNEHSAMTDFILTLAAFDASRAWAELGHASLFTFLERHLRLSKASAFHRSAAPRLVQRFPQVAEALRAGRLCLTSTAELSKVLTGENEAAVLPRFFGLSSREAKDLVAELAPHPAPPVRQVVTSVAQSSGAKAVRAHQPAGLATRREQRGSLFGAARVVTGVEPADPAAPLAVAGGHAKPGTTPSLIWPAAPIRPADDAVPLDADLRRRHVTVSRRFLQRLEAAREAHVRREVWARDQGRCQWPLDGGGTCGSTHRLEIDHVDPAARGGPPTAADLRILCEPHNKEAARRTLGASWMSRLTDDDSERPADHAGRTGSAALTCGLRGDPTGGSAPRPPAHATFGRTLAPVRFPATAVTTAAQFFLWLALAATLGGAMLCLAAGWTTGRIMLTLSLGAALLASSFAAMVWAIDGARDPEAKEDCWRRMLRLAAFSLFCAWMVALGFTPL